MACGTKKKMKKGGNVDAEKKQKMKKGGKVSKKKKC